MTRIDCLRCDAAGVRLVVAMATILFAASTAFAQPTDQDIIKQLTAPGVIKVELSKKPAHKEWSKTDLQYYWVKGAIIHRNANIKEYPDATVEIGGTAAYTIVGETFTWYKFYVTWNEYHGIPTPATQDIIKLLSSNMAAFVSEHRYQNHIVSPVTDIALAENPSWEWHNANSVSVNVYATYDLRPEIYEPKQIDRIKQMYRVRMYREKPDVLFDRFISQTQGEPVVLSSRQLPTDQIKALPSLGLIDATNAARASASGLPQIQVPQFQSDVELFLYTHKMLREAEEPVLKAYLLRTLSPQFFVPDQYPLLTLRGQQLLDRTIDLARHKKMSYAQQYGPDPVLKHYQPGGVQFYNELKPLHATTCRITGEVTGGKLVDGQRVGQEWKLTEIDFYISENPEHIEWLNSFSSPEKLYALHAGQPTLASLVSKVATAASSAATTSSTSPAPAPTASVQTQAPASEPAAPAWQNHAWAEAKFSISLPTAEPKKTTGKAADKYPMYTMDCEYNGGLIRVIAIDYGAPLNKQQATQVVEGMAKGFIDANQARQRGASNWDIGTYGRQYKLTKPGVEMSYRAVVVGSVFYQVMFSATQGQLDRVAESNVYGSFKPAE